MDELVRDLIDRANRRDAWLLEPSTVRPGRYRVRTSAHQIIADDLPRDPAERLVAGYNGARADALALADDLA
ncbi:MAG: hypothetical protein HKO59_04200 [Phycisphaerales bacterium]|nr:hypothetical protein [Phycisphaerae bacterium]NNF43917.1 hypothetical protein [Phycisphaerales bacterium]NNM25180.1 hypothetical protein [Phycisphaerales bacterium]